MTHPHDADTGLSDDERRQIAREFGALVNMTPSMLRAWLASETSRSVGMTHDGDRVTSPEQPEAVGHEMGRTVLTLLTKKVAERGDTDYAAMRKVIGYIHRHGAQRPDGDITETRWRHSLMNWGHDPLRQ